MRDLHSVFRRGCTNVQSQQYTRVLFSPHLSNACYFFLIITILIGMRWYLMVMICVSLVLRNGEHLFMCLLVICMSSKEKCLVRFSTHLKNWNVCFLLVSCMSSLHLLNVNHLSHIRFADIFSHSVYSHSVLLMASLHVHKLLHLM